MTRALLLKKCAVIVASCLLAGSGNSVSGNAIGSSGTMPGWGGNPKAAAQYAPDRKIDIVHLALDVTADFEKRTVKGQITFTFNPIAKPLKELKLNGVDLTIEDVSCTSPVANFESTDKEITISFAQPVPVGTESKLTIKYSAQPNKGLYFRVPSNGYKPDQLHIFTQGEMIEARHWFPCYDHPNEKFTSAVTCRVPEGLIVVSNGKRVSVSRDPQTNLIAYKWLQDKPHANYLITLVAGKFEKLEDKFRDIPLDFYYLSGEKPQAELAFKDTKNMMEFFINETAVDYPWNKYGQVVVRDFHPSGMENTSLTTLNDFILQSAEEENCDIQGQFTSEEIIAHELAHQWWGDLVTCKDWSNAWLNEGFATYYATLFLGNKYGNDRLFFDFNKTRASIFEHKQDWRPIVNRRYEDPWEQFDHRAYQKAAWVIHMLKAELGEDLFKKAIKTYLERFKYQTVVTSDLESVVEVVSGRNFDRFFDQWLYQPGFPELSIDYSWNEENKLAKISVSQKQKGIDQKGGFGKAPDDEKESKNEPLIYHFPLTLRFKSKAETVEKQIEINQKSEDFYVSMKQAPLSVQVDPNVDLLAEIDFYVPKSMLYKQLADKTDTIGRVKAAEMLSKSRDDDTIAKLKSALQDDNFYGVRISAAESLRKIHNENALQALIDSRKQDDARVRLEVIRDIGKYFHPRAQQALLDSLKTEKNPRIIAQGVKGLGPYHQPAVHDAIAKYLATDSYHNMIADGAVEAIRQQDDPSYIPMLKQVIQDKGDAFGQYSFQSALETLGYIDRNEKNRDGVRDFLLSYLTGKRESYQTAAIRALGKLDDPKSIAILETFEQTTRDTSLQKEAERTLSSLRWGNRPHDNLKDLRAEVLDLQKSNREMKKELQELKQKVKALKPSGSAKEASGASTTVKAERLNASRRARKK